jgi:hypothetical protein
MFLYLDLEQRRWPVEVLKVKIDEIDVMERTRRERIYLRRQCFWKNISFLE